MRVMPLSLLCTVPLALAAQEPQDTTVLKPVVVTATRIPTPVTAVPMAVTVISGDALRSQGIRTVADALRAVPGANVVTTDSYGSVTSLFLRGGESDYVKILIDGVPQTGPAGPGGAYDFANLTTDNVDRIEIVRGPVSTLYGSDAVTGVVQIFTRVGRGAIHGNVGVDGGTYGTSTVHGWLGGGNAHASYSLGVSSFSSDGVHTFNNHYRNQALAGQARIQPDERTDGTFSFRYDDALYHFPTDFTGNPVSQNQHQLERGPSLGLDLGRVLSDRVEARVAGTWERSNYLYAIAPNGPNDTLNVPFNSSDWVTRWGVDARANVRPIQSDVLTVGAAFDRESWDGTTLDGSRARNNFAVYTQLVTGLEEPLTFALGARLEDNQRFGTYLTYRASGSFRLAPRTRAIASVGTGFKEPTFYQNFATGFVRGNPDLHPEHSFSWEAGVQYSDGASGLTARATYFDQRFRDLIDYNGADSLPTNYFNVPDANARGVELTGEVPVAAGAQLRVGYTLLHTDVTKGGAATGPTALFQPGEPLIRRPEHTVTLALTYQFHRRGTAALTGLYTGDREDIDYVTFARDTLRSYMRVDFAAHFDVLEPRGSTPGFTISTRVENLFDRAYQEIKNFPARRRTLLFGGEVRFGT